jgi:hypothetical protein
MLTFGQRRTTQVVPVQPQQIEGNEARLAFSQEQVAELSLARVIQADNLSVQNGRLNLELFQGEIRSGTETF